MQRPFPVANNFFPTLLFDSYRETLIFFEAKNIDDISPDAPAPIIATDSIINYSIIKCAEYSFFPSITLNVHLPSKRPLLYL